MSDVQAAATVVVLRDGGDDLQVLMLHKNRGQAFGGMWVFPGGRVDPGDGEPDADECDRARHAAVREALEETGLVLAVDVDGTRVALWDGDAGYLDGDASLDGPRHRLAMPATGAWLYERT